jgi:uracil-DNA glycosylase
MAESAAPYVPHSHSLATLRKAAAGCEGCELYRRATQTVFGEGKRGARVMLVGEQPGDKEDRAGRPFVGPAGTLLRDAIEQSGLGTSVYITNAVKHFNFVERGKQRIHAKPKIVHVRACERWLDAEVDAVAPRLVIALGATAMRAVFGRDLPVGENRGHVIESIFGLPGFATIHPSAILRLRESEERHAEFARFVDDLARAHRSIA